MKNYFKRKEMNALYKSLETALENEYDRILNKAYNIQEYLEQKVYMIQSKLLM